MNQSVHACLSQSLKKNKEALHRLLPLSESFDFITRDLLLGDIPCYFIGLNGMCDLELILRTFAAIRLPDFSTIAASGQTLPEQLKSQFLYAQISIASSYDELIPTLLSGPSLLLLDGFSQGLILDTRRYPGRGIEEPDSEKVIRGAKDGFVETLLTNCNLIRRRLRSPHLTFSLTSVGSLSQTDVALAYLKGHCDQHLIEEVRQQLSGLNTSSLTMGIQSLSELLVKKSFFHPMPSAFLTSRPDVACSYLAEGYLLLLVDNSPFALVLPCSLFQFTQSPDDYYKGPLVGTYLRLVRLICILISLFLMPTFLLFSHYPQLLPSALGDLIPSNTTPLALFIYVLFVELGLELFKYASAHTTSGYSGAFAIVGGLLIGDVAIALEWANQEVIFYGALTLLATLGIVSVELGDALRIYRLFLILTTGFWGGTGFIVGLLLMLTSLITTPMFGQKSYFWPLYPFNKNALKTLLFRYPTFMAQPEEKKKPR